MLHRTIEFDIDLFMKYINAAFHALSSHHATRYTRYSILLDRMIAIKEFLGNRLCPALRPYGLAYTFGSMSILKKGFHASETWKELAPNGMLALIAERHRAKYANKAYRQPAIMPRNEVASAKSTESTAFVTSSLQLHIQRLEHQVALLNRELQIVKSQASPVNQREFEIGLFAAGDRIDSVGPGTHQADNIFHPVNRLSSAGLSPAVSNGDTVSNENDAFMAGNDIDFGADATIAPSPHVVAGDQRHHCLRPSQSNGFMDTAGLPLFAPTKRHGASGTPSDSKREKLKYECTEQEATERVVTVQSSKPSYIHSPSTFPLVPIKYEGYWGTYLVPPNDSHSHRSAET